MIRWSAKQANGRILVGLGLEEENVKRLHDGKPIMIDGTELGIEADIFIHYGQDKKALIAEMKNAGISLPDVVEMDLRPKRDR